LNASEGESLLVSEGGFAEAFLLDQLLDVACAIIAREFLFGFFEDPAGVFEASVGVACVGEPLFCILCLMWSAEGYYTTSCGNRNKGGGSNDDATTSLPASMSSREEATMASVDEQAAEIRRAAR
jgi:hypothetical protein